MRSVRRTGSRHRLGKLPVPSSLWQAILDCQSGQKYVWDEELKKARIALAHETSGLLPTVTEAELTAWRSDFAERHRRGLTQDELRSLLQWQSEEVLRALPLALQGRWKTDLVSRVIVRVEEHFAKRGQPSPITRHSTRVVQVTTPGSKPPLERAGPATTPAPDPDVSLADTEADADQLAAERRDAGDHLGFGEALARRLSYVESSRLDGAIARITAAWASPARLAADVASVEELTARTHEFVT